LIFVKAQCNVAFNSAVMSQQDL